MNANDAALTGLTTAQTGSRVHDAAPNAPAGGGFDPITGAVAGSALGSPGAPYKLHGASASRSISGTGVHTCLGCMARS